MQYCSEIDILIFLIFRNHYILIISCPLLNSNHDAGQIQGKMKSHVTEKLFHNEDINKNVDAIFFLNYNQKALCMLK